MEFMEQLSCASDREVSKYVGYNNLGGKGGR